MKVYKVELMILDFDDIDQDEIKQILEDNHYPNHCMAPKVISIESRDIGEFDDDHPLNQTATAETEFKRLFSDE